jgi:hypothetical protein
MILIFRKNEKTVLNLFLILSIMIISVYDFIDYSLICFGFDASGYFKQILNISIIVLVYILIFRNRHKWERMKSNNYDKSKIQRVWSKPNSVLALLGAATSLSPKCSVRYTYNGKTIRFKRGNKTPILCDTVIRKTDIIQDTNFNKDYFYKRWEEIKNIKYNLLTFNCKMLFKN